MRDGKKRPDKGDAKKAGTRISKSRFSNSTRGSRGVTEVRPSKGHGAAEMVTVKQGEQPTVRHKGRNALHGGTRLGTSSRSVKEHSGKLPRTSQKPKWTLQPSHPLVTLDWLQPQTDRKAESLPHLPFVRGLASRTRTINENCNTSPAVDSEAFLFVSM